MTSRTVGASCLCKAVRLSATLPTLRVGHCHCDNCRRGQGAGFWTWAAFDSEQVRVVEGEAILQRYVSVTGATRSFCGVCGTSLTYESPRWPDTIDISLANFDDPLDQPPSRHSYAEESPEWCPILDDLPRLGGATGQEPLGES